MALQMQSALQIMAIIRFVSPLVLGVILSQTIGKNHAFLLYEACMLHGLTSIFAFQWALPQLMLTRKLSQSLNFQYALLALISGLIAGFIVFVFINTDEQLRPTLEYLFPMILWVISSMGSTPLEYHWLLNGKYQHAILSTFSTYLFSALSAFILLNLSLGMPVVLWSLAAIQMSRTMIYYSHLNIEEAIDIIRKWNIDSIFKPFITISLTFFISGSSLLIDGYIVKYWLSDDDFLFFRLGAREMPISQLLASSFSLLFAYQIQSIVNLQNRHETFLSIRHRTKDYFHWSFVGSALIVLTSQWLVSWVYTPAFSPMTALLDLFMLITIFRVLLPQSVLNAVGLEKYVLYISLAEWVIHLMASWWLVQFFGLKGIGYATLLAYGFEKVALIFIAHRSGYPIGQLAPMRLWAIYSLALLVIYGIKYGI